MNVAKKGLRHIKVNSTILTSAEKLSRGLSFSLSLVIQENDNEKPRSAFQNQTFTHIILMKIRKKRLFWKKIFIFKKRKTFYFLFLFSFLEKISEGPVIETFRQALDG